VSEVQILSPRPIPLQDQVPWPEVSGNGISLQQLTAIF
jgi:hypothetical protein